MEESLYQKLIPRRLAPELAFETTRERSWRLDEAAPQHFQMVVFYRGLHCPMCKTYLQTLEAELSGYAELGTEVIAVSGDTKERAMQTAKEWQLEQLEVGYGLPIEAMRKWGLYISSAVKEGEPNRFGEPALFLIKPDLTIYYAAYNSMPFGRPDLRKMKESIRFVLDNEYPPRGLA